MSTKLIAALAILLVVWLGYKTVVYYQEVSAQRTLQKEEASGKNVDPSKLPGLPYQLEASLRAAEKGGAQALKRWLADYGSQVKDPRKAWIQLDYCTLLARENPREARAVYAEVKQRIREDSPVYPRLKQMARTFE